MGPTLLRHERASMQHVVLSADRSFNPATYYAQVLSALAVLEALVPRTVDRYTLEVELAARSSLQFVYVVFEVD